MLLPQRYFLILLSSTEMTTAGLKKALMTTASGSLASSLWPWLRWFPQEGPEYYYVQSLLVTLVFTTLPPYGKWMHWCTATTVSFL